MVSNDTYRRAVKAADDFVSWAIKTYPQLDAEGLPKILSTYVTASVIFKESGYTWYEASGDGAFVPRFIFKERYPMIPFLRSNYLVSKWKGPVTYYAVKEHFIDTLGNSSYYLPTVDEVRSLVSSVSRVPRIAPLLVVPARDADVKKILEVHLRGRPSDEAR